MKYPILNVLNSYRETLDVFGGYNANTRISEGEFADMEHLSGDKYPLLSQSKARGTALGADGNPVAGYNLIACDDLLYEYAGAWTSMSKECYKEDTIGKNLGEKQSQIVRMGSHLVSFPAKKYASLYDENDSGSLDHASMVSAPTFYPCTFDGTRIFPQISATAPTEPNDGDYWVDTSGEVSVMKIWSKQGSMWTSVGTNYMTFDYGNLSSSYDYAGEEMTDGSSCFIYLYDDNGNQITSVDEMLDKVISTETEKKAVVIVGSREVEISPVSKIHIPIFQATLFNVVKIGSAWTNARAEFVRESPQMDYVIECNNRLWGCRYALDEDGKQINEIYCSKLGDFKNWWVYQGVSTDSYAVTVGRGGKFTGACVYGGRPIFFKEDCMIVIYGDYPAQYQLQYFDCRGVADGSHKSIATVDEVLYYHSRAGICAYNGSLPTIVSDAFGDKRYKNAIGCGFESKYYVCLEDKEGNHSLFVYDTRKGLWHKESNEKITAFAVFKDELYYIGEETYKLNPEHHIVKTMFGSGQKSTEPIHWMAETGNIGLALTDKKYISKFSVRAKVTLGAMVRIFVQYDSCGEWELAQTLVGSKLQVFTFQIPVKRCDHIRLKFVGDGECDIYSITKTIEQGSDK